MKKLRTTEQATIKFAQLKFNIIPWGNSDVLKFNAQRDATIAELNELLQEVADDDIKRQISTFFLKDTVFRYLVEPNITNKDEIKKALSIESLAEMNTLIKELLFLEMYSISRGIEIDVKYKCRYCYEETKQLSEFVFDLTSDVIIEDNIERLEDKIELSVNNSSIIFKLKPNLSFAIDQYVIDAVRNGNLSVIDESIVYRYYLSYVNYVVIDGNNEYPSNDELFDWVMNEIPEGEFFKLISLIGSSIPYIAYIKKDIKCNQCGKTSDYITDTLPDFSLIPSVF